MTPRVFVYVTGTKGVYELLKDGQAVQWAEAPIPEDGFKFWEIVTDVLAHVNFARPTADEPFVAPIVPQEVIDQLAEAGLTIDDAAQVLHEGNKYV